MAKLVERKTYTKYAYEPEYFSSSVTFSLCQHVNIFYKGEIRKGAVHRLNPVKVEIGLYYEMDGKTYLSSKHIRVSPFVLEPLETFHY